NVYLCSTHVYVARADMLVLWHRMASLEVAAVEDASRMETWDPACDMRFIKATETKFLLERVEWGHFHRPLQEEDSSPAAPPVFRSREVASPFLRARVVWA